jgi:hypothetical protein
LGSLTFCHNVQTWGQVEARLAFNNFGCEYCVKACGSFRRAMRFAAAATSV